MGIVVDKVALGHTFLKILRFSPLSINPPAPHSLMHRPRDGPWPLKRPSPQRQPHTIVPTEKKEHNRPLNSLSAHREEELT
jgi:hypothetical protein